MELQILKPRKALNKAFLKVKPNRTEIESFKANLTNLLDSTNDTEKVYFEYVGKSNRGGKDFLLKGYKLIKDFK